MNKSKEFQKRFLRNTSKTKSPLKKIYIFKDKKTIYFLSDGLMKKKVRYRIENLYSKVLLEKVFISLISNRNFNENDEILLDTYVWVFSEPEHTIHYSSSPVLFLRKSSIIHD